MWRAALAIAVGVALTGTVVASTFVAQNRPAAGSGQAHDHGSMPSHGSQMHTEHIQQATHRLAGDGPTMPGQDAFGAIAEIVRILRPSSTACLPSRRRRNPSRAVFA